MHENEQQDEVDEQLWIRTSGCDGRYYLMANGHTFSGRISAYCPTRDSGFSVSLPEIEEMSPESARWVAGFLAGNEPDPEEMFGPGIHDADDADPRWERWRLAVADFRVTGKWPHAGWHYPIPFPSGLDLPAFVWTLRGDEVWAWAGSTWVKPIPSPPAGFHLLEGTVCFDRGHCRMTVVTDVHAVCDDCGHTSETIPGGLTAEEWQRAQYEYRPRPL